MNGFRLKYNEPLRLDQPHVWSKRKNGERIQQCGKNTPEKHYLGGVINYVRDNSMVITVNGDELSDWIEDSLLGVDLMFDEMAYREMEIAMKIDYQSGRLRVAELRGYAIGLPEASFRWPFKQRTTAGGDVTGAGLNDSQQKALKCVLEAQDVGDNPRSSGNRKTTTLVEAIRQTVDIEKQVLVCAPSNLAVEVCLSKNYLTKV